jgi:sigma-B regulation protein RsbQ
MDPLRRNNVNAAPGKKQPMVFVHGYGCDQNMWRFLAPAFAQTHRTVLLDLVGFGASDLQAYERPKYSSLEGHARDVLEIVEALYLKEVILVGHSVSAMIGILAANMRPDRFSRLILVAPSPCYLNDGDYSGGFDRADIEEMIEFLDANFLGWSRKMAPVIMGAGAGSALTEELSNSFCRTDPVVAKHFGRVTFLSDHRADVSRVHVPSLIIQVSNDIIAPKAVGDWLHANMPRAALCVVETTGHCPHMTAPEETLAAMREYLERSL